MFQCCSERYRIEDFDCFRADRLQKEGARAEGKNWIPYVFGPVQVRYAPDNSVIIQNSGKIEMHKIGTVKLSHWEFEKEYRYIVIPQSYWDAAQNKFVLDNDIRGSR